MWFRMTAVAVAMAAFASVARADDIRTAAGIADNSFLIEEAYNQEPGVVQHIATFVRQDGGWTATYVDEWPLFGQTHQLSYTVPDAWTGDGRGFGDLLINYRYQALTETATLPAFAPRLSLIAPTGSKKKGLGSGSLGLDTNMPFSKIVSDRVTLHANAGLTWLADVDEHQPACLRLGFSSVYAVTRDFSVLLETLFERKQFIGESGAQEQTSTITLSPGFRSAINGAGGGQFVFGAAAPIAFSQGQIDCGVFLYLSYEHSFVAKD